MNMDAARRADDWRLEAETDLQDNPSPGCGAASHEATRRFS
jgi:hypothetical protein